MFSTEPFFSQSQVVPVFADSTDSFGLNYCVLFKKTEEINLTGVL